MSELRERLQTLRREPGAGPDRRRRRRWVRPVVAVLAVAIAALALRAWLIGRPTTVDIVRPTVRTAAEAAAGPPVLSAAGYVVARREAIVSSKIQGRLATLEVEEGDRVGAGQVIARLESRDFRAQVERAERGVTLAQAGVDRADADLAEQRRQLGIAERLGRDGIVSEDDLDAARSRVALAEAALEEARAQVRVAAADLDVARASLENTLIRAPFAGTVVKKMAEVGESVAPIPPGVNISTASGAIVALADLGTLEVEVDVSEANVARLVPEQPAWVTVEAFPRDELRGRLRQIIPTADRTKATVTVKVTILDADPRLRPEMSATVDFLERMPDVEALRGAPPVVTVPPDAVVEREARKVVFAIRDGRAVAVPVGTGETLAEGLVVRSGLTGEETLVANPGAGLRNGAAVRAR